MKLESDLDPMAPRPNLDFSKGERGKYANLMKQGTNLVIIEPDLLDTFPDSQSVNDALRGLKKLAVRSAKIAPRLHKAKVAS